MPSPLYKPAAASAAIRAAYRGHNAIHAHSGAHASAFNADIVAYGAERTWTVIAAAATAHGTLGYPRIIARAAQQASAVATAARYPNKFCKCPCGNCASDNQKQSFDSIGNTLIHGSPPAFTLGTLNLPRF